MKIIKKASSINATVIGTPTISNDFIVSNFAANNYLYIPTNFTLTSNDVIQFNVKAKRTGNHTGGILLATAVYSVREKFGKFEIGGNKEWELYYDTCHVLANAGYYTTINTWYWYRIIIDNNTKTISMYGSTTGQYNGEQDLIISGTFTDIISSWYFRIGSDGGNSSSLGWGNFWDGQIDFKETNLKINDNIIWQGIKNKYYYIKSSNNIIIYQPSLDGTEQITTMSGQTTPTISNNTLVGGSGYLTQGWDNTGLWKLSFTAKANSGDCGIILHVSSNNSRDNNLLQLTGNSAIYGYQNSSTVISDDRYFTEIDSNNLLTKGWQDITYEKTGATTIKISMNGYSHTINWTTLQSYNTINIGVDSWGGTAQLKNIVVTNGDAIIKYYGIKSKLVPSRYEVVDYIQSSGTQYIDTGVVTNQNTRVNISFQEASIVSGTGAYVCGSESAYLNNSFDILIQGDSLNAFFNTQYKKYYTSSNTTTVYNINFNKTNVDFYSNGSLAQTSTFSSTTFQSPVNLTLCALNRNGTKQEFSSIKIYYCQIYNNETLVRNYIPVYDTQTQKYGMYDTTGQQFYGNLGTGDFTGGNN